MTDTKNDTKISKFISWALRHKPEEIGLVLDSNGWADVDELLEKAKGHCTFSLEDLQRVVAESNKQRFAFSDDGKKIRANQGHSINVDLKLEVLQPPDVLYHGTATRFLDSIMEEGLKAMDRHDVHLSPSPITANAVGSRHGKPVLLTVDAGRMFAAGFEFRRSANGVWLTKHVHPSYLTVVDSE